MKLKKSALREMIRECLQEELANSVISSKQNSLVEGIFDKKKNSAEYKNSVADFDSEVSKLTKGKDLNDVAYDLANLVSSATSMYKVKAKRKDNHQTHDANLDRDFSVRMKDVRTFATQKLKGIQKAANFAAVGYAVEQIINRILGDFASETDIPGKLQKYTDVLPSVATIQADKAVKQNALKNFAATVIREVNSTLANLDEGLQESITEAATGFRLSGSALLSIEDLADAVYRDNDPDAIKKYASSKDIKDVTAEDLAIAAENSDLSREIKYLAAHMKNKGAATIGDFAAKLNNTKVAEALDEAEDFDLDNIFEALDSLYETDLNEGIFGKKKVEPMGSTKGQKNALAIIKKLSVDLQSDPSWDKQLIEYDYSLGTNEFLSYGLEPSEERAIGILCVEDGADLNSKSPISISPRNNRTRIANTVLQALENTQTASTQHLGFSLRKDAEVAANRNALFIEIIQNER